MSGEINIGRRGLLKLFGMAPALPFAAKAAEMEAAGIGPLGQALGGHIGSYAGGSPQAAINGDGPMKFTTFADFFRAAGARRRLMQQAQDSRALDPDLVAMRLPLTTKLRMQSERNYRRLVRIEEEEFDRRMSLHGFVEWWA
jgi:hypothetical protein